jgi:outer membrane protein
MKKITLICLIILGIFCLTNTFADTTAKFGIIDIQKIMQKSPRIKAAGDRLKEKFASQQNKVIAKQQELKGLLDKYNRDASIMSDSVKQKLQKRILSVRKDYTAMAQKYEQNLVLAQRKEMQKISDEVQKIVSKIAKRERLNAVFLKHALVFSGDAEDITSQVVKAMR